MGTSLMQVPVMIVLRLSVCGVGTYTNQSGRLTSPSYPAYYPSNMDCEYTISVVSDLDWHYDTHKESVVDKLAKGEFTSTVPPRFFFRRREGAH